MRRLLTPSVAVPCAILAAVVAMVGSANVREGRRSRRPFTTARALGSTGAPSTTREGLARRIADMESRLSARPDDVGAAVLLADALIRQTRITGDAGLIRRAEQALNQALRDDPGNYDAMRQQTSLYLSQHRFREALVVAENCRRLRPDDSFSYGVIGDAHLELGDYDE